MFAWPASRFTWNIPFFGMNSKKFALFHVKHRLLADCVSQGM